MSDGSCSPPTRCWLCYRCSAVAPKLARLSSLAPPLPSLLPPWQHAAEALQSLLSALWQTGLVSTLVSSLLSDLDQPRELIGGDGLDSSQLYRVASACSVALGPGAAAMRLAQQWLVEQLQPPLPGRAIDLLLRVVHAHLMAATVVLHLAHKDPGSAHARAIQATVCRPARLWGFLESSVALLHCLDRTTGALLPALPCIACGRLALPHGLRSATGDLAGGACGW